MNPITMKLEPENPFLKYTDADIASGDIEIDHPIIKELVQLCDKDMYDFPRPINRAFDAVYPLGGKIEKYSAEDRRLRTLGGQYCAMVLIASDVLSKEYASRHKGTLEHNDIAANIYRHNSLNTVSHRMNICRSQDGALLARESFILINRFSTNGHHFLCSAYHHGDDEALDFMRKLPGYKASFSGLGLEASYLRWCDQKKIAPVGSETITDMEYLDRITSLDIKLMNSALSLPGRKSLIVEHMDLILATMMGKKRPSDDGDVVIKQFVSILIEAGADWYLAFAVAKKGPHALNILKNRTREPLLESAELLTAASDKTAVINGVLGSLDDELLLKLAARSTPTANKLHSITGRDCLIPLLSKKALREKVVDDFGL